MFLGWVEYSVGVRSVCYKMSFCQKEAYGLVHANTRGGPRLTLCVFLNCSLSYTLKRVSL